MTNQETTTPPTPPANTAAVAAAVAAVAGVAAVAPASATPASSASTDAPASEAGLSPKELKALRKAEKAAKRAAEKEAAGLPARSSEQPEEKRPAKAPSKDNKDKDLKSQKANTTVDEGNNLNNNQTEKIKKRKQVNLFAHLERHTKLSPHELKQVHPSVLALALRYSSYAVVGSTSRCKEMLLVFKSVIKDYETPTGTTLSRNLTSYLSHQIDYLITARPLSVSMGNAIRWLKREISIINIDTSDAVAKRELQSLIDTFIKEKIEASGQVIVHSAAQNINDGDVLLTFARSEVVKQTLVEAHRQGKQFRVIVVDSRPLHEGKKLVSELAAVGIKCTYILINALSYVLKDVTTVFLGAHAMFANGLLYSRVGSALVATSAKSRNIPVLVLCESIKFSDRVQFDAVTLNELSSPDALVNISINSNSPNEKISPALKDWRDVDNLNILNVLYDLTPAEAIKKIVSEVGNLPPSSVPVILREYKSDYNA